MYSQYIMVTPGSKVFGPYHEKRDCYEQLIISDSPFYRASFL